MNDYHLTLADWEELTARFESEDLAARFAALTGEEDWEGVCSLAMDFVNRIFWGDDSGDSGDSRPPDPVPGPFGVWSAFGVFYGQARGLLPEAERRAFDSVHLPFVGPFVETGPRQPAHPFELPAAMKPLRHGGLVIALRPATCKSLEEAARRCTLERLLEALPARPLPPPLPGGFRPALSELLAENPPAEARALLADFRRASSGWLGLLAEAARASKGLLGIYEI